jgi:TatD DNase family protein
VVDSAEMQLIDTHAHICFDDYDLDRQIVMERAFAAGVTKLVHPCCMLSEFPTLIKLTKNYNGNNQINLFAALGVHPCNIDSWSEESPLEFVFLLEGSLTQGTKLRAIGETGLDYFHARDESIKAKQREVFQFHIDTAKQHKLPLILHIRDAWEDALAILSTSFNPNRNNASGVLHCYTGDLDFALAAIDLGFYVSWSGVLTFKKNDSFRTIASQLPIDRVLVETDAPYLAPQAKRGQRNEPSFVQYTAEVLANCYQLTLDELATITTENAQTLFKI